MYYFSIVEDFSILETSVSIWELLQSVVSLRLLSSRHQSNLIHFEHWLKEIRSAVIHDTLELIETRIIEETIVVQVGFVNLHRAPLVAHHEFLESQEAEVPRITFLISNEF